MIVLDLNLPDRHGLDLLMQLRTAYPKIPVLILSMHRESAYAVRLLKAGAAGYISKDSAREQLVEGIRTVARGDRFSAPSVGADDGDRHGRLSDREFQVMLMIAAGKPPRQIADELSVSVKTVGAHRAHILQKMGLRNNAGIVQYVLSQKMM